MHEGHVFLVGAGPGDPDLITVKGVRALQQADVVVYDRLASKDLLDLVPRSCLRIYAGKRKHLHAMSQKRIHCTLIEHAKLGRRVVRLKGGDPFIFGRGGEEVAALEDAGVAWTVVPGVTAAFGASASCGLPLTHRGASRAVTLVTAHRLHGRLELDWELVMRSEQTVVFYMGLSVLDELVGELLARGQPSSTSFSVVANATKKDEVVVHSCLGEIVAHPMRPKLPSPAVLVMHGGQHSLADADVVRIAAASGV